MRQATDLNTYSGNFVVMTSSGVMSSSRVWHVCDGHRQIERLEALSGTPRIVYRQNAEVRTFSPNDRVVRIESREMPRKFARAKGISGDALVAHYAAQFGGHERIAGKDADLLQLRPRDAWRFGYRVWLDHASGLVLKWQTITPGGRVLEQAVFSELELTAPVGGAQIESMMNDVVGYRIIAGARAPTTMETHGWTLPVPVEGFMLLSCEEKRKLGDVAKASVQCVYSDGLASISVFLEPYNEERHAYNGQELRLGATHTLSGRVAGDAWVTMVGEVPLATLRLFASAIKQLPH
ncbi:MucB/RseB C-terminal domain-containing protein [Diaphorobacter sp. NR2-3-3-1]|nr:MucB/RseB C-terminal domain-containing protein [Diaphorobacter caeni]